MGSKSKQSKMKSNQLQNKATAQKNQKKENAQDIISKSLELYHGKKQQDNRKKL